MSELHTAMTRNGKDGRIEVLCPKVGIWVNQPRNRSLLGSGAEIGALRFQTRRFTLQHPPGIAGRFSETVRRDRSAPVEYGETLFVLEPMDSALNEAGDNHESSTTTGDKLPPGCLAVTAPTDGVFYARPSPEAPTFVSTGDRIGIGHTIGLIEVMKTFNPILYGGPDLPDEAKVVELRAEDGKEIRAGELLLVVE